MDSKLARESRLALIATHQRLTPEERLNAFLEHSQLMAEFYQAGQALRSAPEPPPPKRFFKIERTPGP